MSLERQQAYSTVYEPAYLQKIWAMHMRSRIACVFALLALLTKLCRIFEKHNGDKIRSILPRVNCPVLLIHGERDPIVENEQTMYLLRNLPRARFERINYSLPKFLFSVVRKADGDHSTHLKHPAWFRQQSEQFLDTI